MFLNVFASSQGGGGARGAGTRTAKAERAGARGRQTREQTPARRPRGGTRPQ